MAPCATDVSDDMVLEIIHQPAVEAGNNGIVCENGSAQLYGYAGFYNSFEWSTSGDGTFDNSNSLYAMYTPGSNDLQVGSAIITLTVYPIAPCADVVTDQLVMSVMPLPEAAAGEDGEICYGEVFAIEGSVENEYIAIWSTSGDGAFEDANDPQTIYTPGEEDMLNGAVSLTLTAIANNPCSVDAMDVLELIVNPVINYVDTPMGPDSVNSVVTPQSEYSAESDYATDYNWFVYPPIAGSIADGNPETTIIWNENFVGMAYIYVKAINDCNVVKSDTLEVEVVSIITGLEQMLSNGSIEIIPNPNNGQFVLEMNGLMGETVIEVINSSGALVQKIETNMLSKEKHSVNFELSGYSSGVYYLKLVNKDQIMTKKFIINN